MMTKQPKWKKQKNKGQFLNLKKANRKIGLFYWYLLNKAVTTTTGLNNLKPFFGKGFAYEGEMVAEARVG